MSDREQVLAGARLAYERELYGLARDAELARLWHVVRVARTAVEAESVAMLRGWMASGYSDGYVYMAE